MSTLNIIHYFPIVIANGDTASAEIDLKGMTVVGIFTPAALTGTALTFQAAREAAGTFVPVVDTAGSALSITIAASKFIQLLPTYLMGVRNLKIVSGSAEGAARTFYLACRPYAS